jgi:protein-tyrosine sulfotransferase
VLSYIRSLFDSLKISQAMKLQSPVFIVGLPRSGTSLLNKLLLTHPSFKSIVDDEVVESRAFERGFPLRFPIPTSQYMHNNNTAIESFFRTAKTPILVRRATSRIQTNWDTSSNYKLRQMLWKASLSHIVVRNYFFFAAQARGCKRIVEKTPDHLNCLPEMIVTFPQAKFLCIYRHPVEVFSSYKKRLERDDKITAASEQHTLDWLRISVNDFCAKYHRSMERAMALAASYPEDIRLVKYEELVTNSDKEIANIMTFLVEPPLQSVEITPDDRSSNKAEPIVKILSKTKVWQDWISLDDAVAIESALASIMGRLGYTSLVSN